MIGRTVNKNRIVITGLSGNIGHILYAGLQGKWDISGVDIVESTELLVTLVNISDINSIGDAFNEAYAVIHLAANAYAGADWETIIGPNIIGTRNVFRAALESRVEKIIFASSNHVTGLYEKDEPYRSIVAGQYKHLNPADIPQIDHTTPVRPDGYYMAPVRYSEKPWGDIIAKSTECRYFAFDSDRYPGETILSVQDSTQRFSCMLTW